MKSMGDDFRDLWENSKLITDEMRDSINLEVDLIGKLIEAREKRGITQQKLAEMTGLKQSAVARLENLTAVPQIDTLLKVLRPLGYTLKIVPVQSPEPSLKE